MRDEREIEERLGEIDRKIKNTVNVMGIAQKEYQTAIAEAMRLKNAITDANYYISKFSSRIGELTRLAWEQQKKEDFQNLVTETCHDPVVDLELRRALYDEISTYTLLQEKQSLFREIEALFDLHTSGMDMCLYNIRRLERDFQESRDRLHLSMTEFEKETARIAKVGLPWEVS